MTISGTYTQSLSFSLNITTVRVGAAASHQPASSSADSVTLSPEAAVPPTTDAPVPQTAPAGSNPSPSAKKAETLLRALDADNDGSITKEEFTEGALALLGRPGRGHRRDGDTESDGAVERHDHRSRRFENRLAKVFDRVDANDDGTLDASELTSALARTKQKNGRHGCCDHATQPAPVAQASYASVTVVAIAVKQYTAISAASV